MPLKPDVIRAGCAALLAALDGDQAEQLAQLQLLKHLAPPFAARTQLLIDQLPGAASAIRDGWLIRQARVLASWDRGLASEFARRMHDQRLRAGLLAELGGPLQQPGPELRNAA